MCNLYLGTDAPKGYSTAEYAMVHVHGSTHTVSRWRTHHRTDGGRFKCRTHRFADRNGNTFEVAEYVDL